MDRPGRPSREWCQLLVLARRDIREWIGHRARIDTPARARLAQERLPVAEAHAARLEMLLKI